MDRADLRDVRDAEKNTFGSEPIDGLHLLVEVTWWDAHGLTEGWTPISELRTEPCVVRSVGYVLPNVQPHHLVLAQSLNDTEADNVISIPELMVQTCHTLKETP